MTGDQGEWLAGNVGGAWRVGETVRRATGPWTPAVHALLDHLQTRLDHVPRVLGFDEHGREVLTYLPGRVVDIDTEILSEKQLRSIVRWTRTFHETVAGFTHDGPWRFFEVDAPTLIGHNDIAPTTPASTRTSSSGSSTGTSLARQLPCWSSLSSPGTVCHCGGTSGRRKLPGDSRSSPPPMA